MSNHKIALVPIASGFHQSPELLARGQKADTGLFAESLIYYDSVYVHVDNHEQFADFISLLIQQGLSYNQLIELVEEGALRFYNTVLLLPFMGFDRWDMISSLWAVQEEAMTKPGYFAKRFLDFEGLKNSFSNLSSFDKRAFDKFCEVAERTAVTFSNEEISDGLVDNAYDDFLNPKRYKLIVKSLLNEIYRIHHLGKPPNFEVQIRESNSANFYDIAQNLKSTVVGRNFGNGEYKIYEVESKPPIKNIPNLEDKTKQIVSFASLPLSSAGVSNLYIASASKLNCDLFLSKPISRIVGDKLYEISDIKFARRDLRIQNIVEKLESKVEFPDLQRFVNSNKIEFDKILEIRKKAKRFREWL